MIENNTFLIKNFLSEAIEMNSHFLQLKIREEAEKLLPFEKALQELKGGYGIPDNLPELVDQVNQIIRLKKELKITQQLARAIEQGASATC